MSQIQYICIYSNKKATLYKIWDKNIKCIDEINLLYTLLFHRTASESIEIHRDSVKIFIMPL